MERLHMNEQEALAYLAQAGQRGSRLGLARTRELLHRLGDPQRSLRCIHVAGTNGKGSVCAMLAAVLTEAGFRTGLYTSPHLRRLHERIRVNGAEIRGEALAALTAHVRRTAAQMSDPPTQFELLTAMAVLYFYQQRCDLTVLEVGLGGRLDATNVIPPPEATVITHIGLDHTEVLGGSLKQIAGEKAGIIKCGSTVILSRQDARAEAAVRTRCRDVHAPLRITRPCQPVSADLHGQVFHYQRRMYLKLGLSGDCQLQNAAAALDTLDVLITRGYHISEQAIRDGLAHAVWPGRFEVLRDDPTVIVDGAHNPQGTAYLLDSLQRLLPGRRFFFLTGVMADKDYWEMMALAAPHAKAFFTVTPPSPRALPAKALADALQPLFQGPIVAADTVEEGLALALGALGEEDALCVFGSLYQVGTVRSFFGKS